MGDGRRYAEFRTATAVDLSVVRRANERAVMTRVALFPGSSAADIAKALNLGPQTVGKIVVELEARGLVARGEVKRGLRGKPATPVMLASNGAFAIGCEVGWRHCQVDLVSIRGEVLGRHRWDYAFPEPVSLFRAIGSVAELLRKLLPEADRPKLTEIAIAAPFGIADQVELLGGTRADAEAWQGVDLVAEIAAATGLAPTVSNDGNAACWGELVLMPKPRPAGFCYFLVDTFILAGIVSDVGLWEGPTGNSADLGLTLVESEGHAHFVHTVAGLYALQRRVVLAGMPLPAGDPIDWAWDSLEPVLTDWIDEAGRAIATAILNTTAVVELDLAVVDGVMPGAINERFLASVRRHLAVLPQLPTRPLHVEPGRSGATAAARGAAQYLIYRRYFSGNFADLGV